MGFMDQLRSIVSSAKATISPEPASSTVNRKPGEDFKTYFDRLLNGAQAQAQARAQAGTTVRSVQPEAFVEKKGDRETTWLFYPAGKVEHHGFDHKGNAVTVTISYGKMDEQPSATARPAMRKKQRSGLERYVVEWQSSDTGKTEKRGPCGRFENSEFSQESAYSIVQRFSYPPRPQSAGPGRPAVYVTRLMIRYLFWGVESEPVCDLFNAYTQTLGTVTFSDDETGVSWAYVWVTDPDVHALVEKLNAEKPWAKHPGFSHYDAGKIQVSIDEAGVQFPEDAKAFASKGGVEDYVIYEGVQA